MSSLMMFSSLSPGRRQEALWVGVLIIAMADGGMREY
jgi:hypothetical protein